MQLPHLQDLLQEYEETLWEDVPVYPEAIGVLSSMYEDNRQLCNNLAQRHIVQAFELATDTLSARHLSFLQRIVQTRNQQGRTVPLARNQSRVMQLVLRDPTTVTMPLSRANGQSGLDKLRMWVKLARAGTVQTLKPDPWSTPGSALDATSDAIFALRNGRVRVCVEGTVRIHGAT